MANKTDAMIVAIKNRGWVEVASKSRKVRTFFDPRTSGLKKLFFGRAGSVRYGTCYTKSHPIRRGTKNDLLAEGLRLVEHAHIASLLVAAQNHYSFYLRRFGANDKRTIAAHTKYVALIEAK